MRIFKIYLLPTIIIAIFLFSVHTKSVEAQNANSYYFQPQSLILNPNGTIELKANVGTNSVIFVGVKMKIDISKIQLAGEITFPLVQSNSLHLVVPPTSINNINCSPTFGNTNCTDGFITFALAVFPGTNNSAQSGTFTVAQIPLKSVQHGNSAVTSVTFADSGNELLVSATEELEFSKIPAEITAQPIPNLGNMDSNVTIEISDLRIFFPLFNSEATAADFNNSGRVDISDYSILVKNYGQ